MKISKIQINRGVTVNLGNYESIRYDVALTADLAANERTPKAVRTAMGKLDKEVRNELRALVLSTCNEGTLSAFGLEK